VGWVAALAFLLSWFAPALPDVPGWMAFRYSLAPLVPFREARDIALDDSVPQVLSALTNLVFILLFVLWQLKQSPRPGLFVRITLACVLLNLYWLVRAWRDGGLADLRFGYYLWLAAFVLLAVVAGLIAAESRARLARAAADSSPSP
jgi:hypothetical protein